MSKEWVEEIKDRLKILIELDQPYIGLEIKEAERFIEQVEHVSNMMSLVKYHKQKQKEAEDENEPYRHENRKLKLQNKQLRNALDTVNAHIQTYWNQGYGIQATLYISKVLERDTQ